ncbi:MAG TPA: peptide ABC transporter substrate-binding protein [Verrucomicrobiae bacterium]|jgi:peptide/nickel transport system substrate-binding protein|nr:peptide ABC transporter substrate-binding protein [Verrucomicrobiae bacterium]
MKRALALLLTGAMLFVFAACSKSGQITSDGTLRIGTAIAPNSFNPLLATESVENMLDRLVFDELVVADADGNLKPKLASVVPTQLNGGVSKDGLTVTYHLRHGVKWQDGAPFTSADVSFSFEQVMNPRNNVTTQVGYDAVARVETPDPYTVIFHLKHSYAPFVSTIFSSNVSPGLVLPEHLLRGKPDLNSIAFNSAPVGTGPFRMVEWLRGDRITFEANPHYFLGKPQIPRIVVQIIPDENTAINEMRTHELDWFYNASEASYNQLKTISTIKTFVSTQNSYRGMLINIQSPLVSDVRVRRAIAYAIDKATIVEKVTYGAAGPATEDLPSFMWAYDPHVKTYGYDPAQARALLAQAGWTPGPGGVLQKNGTRMELRFALRRGAVADTEMSVIIQSELRLVGIATSIKTYPGSMLFLNGTSGVLAGGHYDIELSGFGSGLDPDNSAQFECASRPPNGYNWSRYCNLEMDAAQKVALGSYDQRVRKNAYAKIETLLARDVPQIFMYWAPEIDAVNPGVKNFRPGRFFPDWNAYQWSW